MEPDVHKLVSDAVLRLGEQVSFVLWSWLPSADYSEKVFAGLPGLPVEVSLSAEGANLRRPVPHASQKV